ncbi:hypothetical protein E1B28_002120 [Marasmius oreades]|uniref:RanBD1 domain-containing protein n=1 Tax=Marasmius oreades TaxID=181124 RepID=A0A9P7RM32_9AGAR|nr:uncharacterized protein E1B28_002120 [Marasmius oreades]KAG7086159.1 hypothetical protein E1B28_002120 [Marasmius oreades]
MFPVVSEFTFVVCGMASFAATVGYVCSKRIVGGSSDSLSSNSIDIESVPIGSGNVIKENAASELLENARQSKDALRLDADQVFPQVCETKRSSLKRKATHDEEYLNSLGYPYNLAAIYPNKRSRTPTRERENEIPLCSPIPVKLEDNIAPNRQSVSAEPIERLTEESTAASSPIVTAVAECSAAPGGESSENAPDLTSPSTSETTRENGKTLSSIEVPSSKPTFPQGPPPTVHQKPAMSFTSPSSGGFASFARSSTFKSMNMNINSTAGPPDRPVWASCSTKEATPLGLLVDTVTPAPLEASTKPKTQHPTPDYTHVTGEENEAILSEARGVKLFIKRGSKEFSDSIFGHVKLLSSGDKTRLVFRREPLRQVTMNTWLSSPSVRCTRDEENVLRVIGLEGSEIVVYALKPGRGCTKQDFNKFALYVLERNEGNGL